MKMSEKLSLNGVKEIARSGISIEWHPCTGKRSSLYVKASKKESGGGSIWDFAATACIYQELGLPATNFEGGRLDLNRKDGTFMNHEGVFYANLMPSD